MFEEPFKKCGSCGVSWPTRVAFVSDPQVLLVGYQPNFVFLEKGLFLFNHTCESTLSIDVAAFSDLYDGPMFVEKRTGQPGCPGYCLHRTELRPCPEQCECAYVRHVLDYLKYVPKLAAPGVVEGEME